MTCRDGGSSSFLAKFLQECLAFNTGASKDQCLHSEMVGFPDGRWARVFGLFQLAVHGAHELTSLDLYPNIIFGPLNFCFLVGIERGLYKMFVKHNLRQRRFFIMRLHNLMIEKIIT